MTQSARKKKILDFFFSRKKMPNFSRLKACEFISRDQSHSQSLTLIHGQLSNKKIGSFFIRAQKCGRQPFLRKNHLLATITKEQTCFLSELLMNCNHFDSPWAYFCHLFAKQKHFHYNKIQLIVPTNFSVFVG